MFKTAIAIFVVLAAAQSNAQTLTTVINNGPSSNRVDLVVLGDGYTSAEMGKYMNDVQQFVLNMFAQQPYFEYQRYFNVHRIDIASPHSGVDHPELGILKTTALDGTYNCAGIQRLICVDTGKVTNIVTSVTTATQRDLILVIVNDAEYGGSGGSVAVSSTHPDGVEIVLHELGHSFALLADEYGGPPPPDCNAFFEPPEVNATASTTLAAIKWKLWIAAGTPIPTFRSAMGVPGLYEGAKYCDAGVYRPTYESKMRALGRPFEHINTEQHVKRTYNWVSPVDVFDPVSRILTIRRGQTRRFSVTTVIPRTPTIGVRWLVDGQQKGVGSTFVFDSALYTSSTHTVQAVARDTTTMVRSDPANLLSETVPWSVTVVGSRPDVSRAKPTVSLLWPPNHRMERVSIVGVTDADNDPINITINRIIQDEPTNGLGNGATCPDAQISGSTAWLRAERSGSSNGRVYTILFTARDAHGASTPGSVRVEVPRNANGSAIDDRLKFDSTACTVR